ncbi:MAG: CRISPR-associated endonuclease Cas1, partial [Candidatus Eremiobacterota bacterium]
SLRLKQYERVMDKDFALSAAASLVKGKLTNLRTMLMRFNRSSDLDIGYSALQIRNCIKSLDTAKTLDSVRGFEGAGTSAYFSAFPKILKYDLGFRKRVKRPPTDPVNALLSFGYVMLCNDINTAVNLVGLDPYMGFLHEPQDRKTSLVFDLMEEFRPVIVDSIVISSINRKYFDFSDFEPDSETGGINISKSSIARFISYYQERLSTVIFHNQSKHHVTYKKCFELQARLMARYIRGEADKYISVTPK